jgi:hypothetical protein
VFAPAAVRTSGAAKAEVEIKSSAKLPNKKLRMIANVFFIFFFSFIFVKQI